MIFPKNSKSHFLCFLLGATVVTFFTLLRSSSSSITSPSPKDHSLLVASSDVINQQRLSDEIGQLKVRVSNLEGRHVGGGEKTLTFPPEPVSSFPVTNQQQQQSGKEDEDVGLVSKIAEELFGSVATTLEASEDLCIRHRRSSNRREEQDLKSKQLSRDLELEQLVWKKLSLDSYFTRKIYNDWADIERTIFGSLHWPYGNPYTVSRFYTWERWRQQLDDAQRKLYEFTKSEATDVADFKSFEEEYFSLLDVYRSLRCSLLRGNRNRVEGEEFLPHYGVPFTMTDFPMMLVGLVHGLDNHPGRRYCNAHHHSKSTSSSSGSSSSSSETNKGLLGIGSFIFVANDFSPMDLFFPAMALALQKDATLLSILPRSKVRDSSPSSPSLLTYHSSAGLRSGIAPRGVAGSWNLIGKTAFKGEGSNSRYGVALNNAVAIFNADTIMKPGRLFGVARLLRVRAERMLTEKKSKAEDEEAPLQILMLLGFAAFVWTEIGFERGLGLFDENLYPAYAEDTEMQIRASSMFSASSRYNPESQITEADRGNLRKLDQTISNFVFEEEPGDNLWHFSTGSANLKAVSQEAGRDDPGSIPPLDWTLPQRLFKRSMDRAVREQYLLIKWGVNVDHAQKMNHGNFLGSTKTFPCPYGSGDSLSHGGGGGPAWCSPQTIRHQVFTPPPGARGTSSVSSSSLDLHNKSVSLLVSDPHRRSWRLNKQLVFGCLLEIPAEEDLLHLASSSSSHQFRAHLLSKLQEQKRKGDGSGRRKGSGAKGPPTHHGRCVYVKGKFGLER